jgi:hypothetical protein
LLPRTNSSPSNQIYAAGALGKRNYGFFKQICGRLDGANAEDAERNLIQFEGFDFLVESEEFDALFVKTIMEVEPANLEYLC